MKPTVLKFSFLAAFLLMFQLIDAQQSICPGETKTYTVDASDGPNGTPGSTYAWTASGTGYAGTLTDISGNSVSINWGSTPPGTYTVQVIETNNGCPGVPKTITVTINPLPTAPTIANNTPICSGEDAVFTITGTPNLQVTYNINGGANQTTTIGAGGTATVTVTGATTDQTLSVTSVTNGTCPLTGITTVSSTVVVNASLPSPTLSSNTPICSGADAVFTITGTPNLQVTYNINGGANQTTTIGAGGTATVTVTGATANQTLTITSITNGTCPVTGLAISETVTVNPLPATPTISSNSPICSGADAVFTITGTPNLQVTYNINGGANQTTTIGAGGTATVTVTGATANQTLTITSVTNGTCPSNGLTVSETVTVNPLPTAPTISNNSPICSGEDAIFTITGAPNLQVTYNINGGANQTTTIGAGGTAIVTVTGATANQTLTITGITNGTCPLTGLNVSSTISVNASLTPPTLSSNTPICSGEDAVFTITGTPNLQVTYNINGGANQTTTIGAGGTATVTVTGATANQTLTISSITNGTCPVTGLTITETVILKPTPVTSDIDFD